MSYWVVEGARRRRDDPAFAKRFGQDDEMLENATRLERGRRQADRDDAENEE